MEAKEPALASALHRSIARIMAARLSENNVLLAALLD
jgi:hypothetical protein